MRITPNTGFFKYLFRLTLLEEEHMKNNHCLQTVETAQFSLCYNKLNKNIVCVHFGKPVKRA